MTRLERKKAELDKLYQYRAAAMRNNDLTWMHRNQEKITELEKEIIEMKKYEPIRLSEALAEKGEGVKNEIYKALLRVSVLADVVNNACFECREKLNKHGLQDFSFRKDVSELCRLSQKIASIVLIPNSPLLEDFIVDDDTVVDGCTELADKYLHDKLNL